MNDPVSIIYLENVWERESTIMKERQMGERDCGVQIKWNQGTEKKLNKNVAFHVDLPFVSLQKNTREREKRQKDH